MVWTDAVIARLTELWDSGIPSAEIGRVMGVSKNAIVGKAHRLGLVARPSPIRGHLTYEERVQRENEAQARKERGILLTLPPIGTVEAVKADLVPTQSVPSVAAYGGVRPAAKPVIVAPPPPPPPPVIRRTSTCCFPAGTPGKRDFKFCDKPVMGRGPYCQPCADKAYVKMRKPVEEVAGVKRVLAAL